MSATLPVATACCNTCDDQVTVAVPGPAGSDGAPGADGADGQSSISLTTEDWVVPAELDSTGVAVNNDMFWASPGQIVYLYGAGTAFGYFRFLGVVAGQCVLENLENTPASLYVVNQPPGTAVPTGTLIGPSGMQGPAGTSASAGPATDNYFILGQTPPSAPALPNAQVLGGLTSNPMHWNNGTGLITTGLISLTSKVTGTLPIANGGTGQTTANPAFNALSPVTTRGDLIYRDATVNARLPIGAANTVLRTNGTDPSWGKVVLTTDVSGILPAANGGTGTIAVDLYTSAGPHSITTANRDIQIMSAAVPTFNLPTAAATGEGFVFYFHNHSGFAAAVVNRAGADFIVDQSGTDQALLNIAASEYYSLVSDGVSRWYIRFYN